MKISTEIGSASKLVGEEKAIEYVARAGFDAWDFSMFSMFRGSRRTREVLTTDHPLSGDGYLQFARRLKQIGIDNGIHCNQSHAPFPTLWREAELFLKRAIECTAEVGGEICVIHPHNDLSAEKNAEIFAELLPFAKSYGVKIAAENMWNWNQELNQAATAACSSHEDFKAHLDALNDDFLVACVDIGHAEMRGLGTTAPDMIRHLGGKVAALHIHDNDRWHDSHEIPFSMQIDFAPIMKALREIGYRGYLTLEADAYLRNAGCTADNALQGMEQMAAAAKRLQALYHATSSNEVRKQV